jgi:hypothetical protein
VSISARVLPCSGALPATVAKRAPLTGSVVSQRAGSASVPTPVRVAAGAGWMVMVRGGVAGKPGVRTRIDAVPGAARSAAVMLANSLRPLR